MHKLFAVLIGSATLCAFGAVLFFYTQSVPAAPTSDPNLTIENRTLVDSRRVSRTESEFTYSADLNNTGPDISGATVTVSSSSPHTTVVDGELEFGAVATGTTATSTDTFSIRQDRREEFDPESLTYTVGSKYADENHGFSILYPDNMRVLESNSNPPDLPHLYTKSISYPYPDGSPLNVLLDVYTNGDGLPVVDWFNEHINALEFHLDPGSSLRQTKEIYLDGVISLQVRTVAMGIVMNRTYIPKDNIIICITMDYSDIQDESQLLPIYESIVSSFAVQ